MRAPDPGLSRQHAGGCSRWHCCFCYDVHLRDGSPATRTKRAAQRTAILNAGTAATAVRTSAILAHMHDDRQCMIYRP